jgi:hypothetical protein
VPDNDDEDNKGYEYFLPTPHPPSTQASAGPVANLEPKEWWLNDLIDIYGEDYDPDSDMPLMCMIFLDEILYHQFGFNWDPNSGSRGMVPSDDKWTKFGTRILHEISLNIQHIYKHSILDFIQLHLNHPREKMPKLEWDLSSTSLTPLCKMIGHQVEISKHMLGNIVTYVVQPVSWDIQNIAGLRWKILVWSPTTALILSLVVYSYLCLLLFHPGPSLAWDSNLLVMNQMLEITLLIWHYEMTFFVDCMGVQLFSRVDLYGA